MLNPPFSSSFTKYPPEFFHEKDSYRYAMR
nr:MAG TPA: hypothetical protein [Caudoviricetes sp.]